MPEPTPSDPDVKERAAIMDEGCSAAEKAAWGKDAAEIEAELQKRAVADVARCRATVAPKQQRRMF